MKAIFEKINMFGTSAKLSTFGKSSFRTALGGIMILVTIIAIGFFNYLFIWEGFLPLGKSEGSSAGQDSQEVRSLYAKLC